MQYTYKIMPTGTSAYPYVAVFSNGRVSYLKDATQVHAFEREVSLVEELTSIK